MNENIAKCLKKDLLVLYFLDDGLSRAGEQRLHSENEEYRLCEWPPGLCQTDLHQDQGRTEGTAEHHPHP